MLDGVEVNVIKMVLKVVFVAYQMFPKAPLPYSSIATFLLRRSHWYFVSTLIDPSAREGVFEVF